MESEKTLQIIYELTIDKVTLKKDIELWKSISADNHAVIDGLKAEIERLNGRIDSLQKDRNDILAENQKLLDELHKPKFVSCFDDRTPAEELSDYIEEKLERINGDYAR